MTDSPLSPSLIAWGATYTPAVVKAGESYWRLIIADGPMDIGGNHHLYVDVWGLDGQRQVGVPVVFFTRNPDHEDRRKTEAKTGEPYSVNLPLYAGGNAYGVWVEDGSQSDTLFGVGLGSFVPHQSFRAIFQRTIAEGDTDDNPTVPPTATDSIQVTINGVTHTGAVTWTS